MEAFLGKLSYHATSYAIRSCLALTSTYVLRQGSKLLQSVDDDPVKEELARLQQRLARKIELISPILEALEFRYTRGNLALKAVAKTSQEIRHSIESLGLRLEDATLTAEQARGGTAHASEHRARVTAILCDIKELIVSIDDAIPLINLWVSALGGIKAGPASFSPSRLLQASMLVNVGDTQYLLQQDFPMQIGPDFTLSLYMLFRGHSSAGMEPYGFEDGQRRPTWQEVIHKARVRLHRVPAQVGSDLDDCAPAFAYRLQIVEDLCDGRVHTFEDNEEPVSFDGLQQAGMRESIPVGQISKMFYVDVGRILNINGQDGGSNKPVLLIKRDVQPITSTSVRVRGEGMLGEPSMFDIKSVAQSPVPTDTNSAADQGEIDRQLREENTARSSGGSETFIVTGDVPTIMDPSVRNAWTKQWGFPRHLDPEWVALEVFEQVDDSLSSDGEEPNPEDEDFMITRDPKQPRRSDNTPVDSNLIHQLGKMSIGPMGSPRRASQEARFHPQQETLLGSSPASEAISQSVLQQSPFGAIKTSLSLLEMLLRLTSLQEFEQKTHLAITDQVLRFYLDESTNAAGQYGAQDPTARAEATQKVGFDPFDEYEGSEPGTSIQPQGH